MANQLGTMTAAAVLNAKQFTAGLDKVKSDANKTKAAVDGTFGRNISLIGGLVGFDKLKGLFFQSVARLNQEIAAKEAAGKPLSELETQFQAAKDRANGIVSIWDNFVMKVVVGLDNIAIAVRDATVGAPRFVSTLDPAEIARREAFQRAVAPRQRTERIQELIERGDLGGARNLLTVQSNSRNELTERESDQRRFQRLAANTQYIAGLQRELLTIRMTDEERQRYIMSLDGASAAEIRRTEALQNAIRTERMIEQAKSPLERFQDEMQRLNELSRLDDTSRARLVQQAFAGIEGMFSRQNSTIGNLEQGSREVAEILLQRDSREVNVGAIMQAASEAQRQRDERSMSLLEQIREWLATIAEDDGVEI